MNNSESNQYDPNAKTVTGLKKLKGSGIFGLGRTAQRADDLFSKPKLEETTEQQKQEVLKSTLQKVLAINIATSFIPDQQKMIENQIKDLAESIGFIEKARVSKIVEKLNEVTKEEEFKKFWDKLFLTEVERRWEIAERLFILGQVEPESPEDIERNLIDLKELAKKQKIPDLIIEQKLKNKKQELLNNLRSLANNLKKLEKAGWRLEDLEEIKKVVEEKDLKIFLTKAIELLKMADLGEIKPADREKLEIIIIENLKEKLANILQLLSLDLAMLLPQAQSRVGSKKTQYRPDFTEEQRKAYEKETAELKKRLEELKKQDAMLRSFFKIKPEELKELLNRLQDFINTEFLPSQTKFNASATEQIKNTKKSLFLKWKKDPQNNRPFNSTETLDEIIFTDWLKKRGYYYLTNSERFQK